MPDDRSSSFVVRFFALTALHAVLAMFSIGLSRSGSGIAVIWMPNAVLVGLVLTLLLRHSLQFELAALPGAAIAGKFSRLLRGRPSVESEAGTGSTFTVHLPFVSLAHGESERELAAA